MPGLHVLSFSSRIHRETLNQASNELLYRDDFKLTEVYCAENNCILFSGHNNYPRTVYENDNILVLLEGLIYNKNDEVIINDLEVIAKRYITNQNYKHDITTFIDDSDGDFLALLFFKRKGDVLIFNDRWGRLPAFYSSFDNKFILSREVKFILNFLPSIEFDRTGMAEFLSLEYNLGDKTIIKNIKRMMPASLLQVNNTNGVIKSSYGQLISVNFKIKDVNMTRKEAVSTCHELFIKSIDLRVNKLKEKGLNLTADLSGGYDTRAVFGGLCRVNAEFTACNDNLITGDESKIARQLADLFGKNLHSFSAFHPVNDMYEMARINYITDGMINTKVNTACFYDDLERRKKIKGYHANFMGLGGEFLRRIYRKKSFYRGVPEMLIDNAFTHYISVNDSCAILKIDRNTLKDNFQNEINVLNETATGDIVRHIYFDYYSKAVSAGENRHRIFNWTVAPFWGKDLFDFATRQIPPEYITYGFYFQLLEKLDPKLLDVPIFGSNVKLNSAFSRTLYKTGVKIKTTVRDNKYLFKIAKRFYGRSRRLTPADENLSKLVNQLFQTCVDSQVLNSCINVTVLERFMNKNANILQIYQLLTLILYIQEVEKRFSDKIEI